MFTSKLGAERAVGHRRMCNRHTTYNLSNKSK